MRISQYTDHLMPSIFLDMKSFYVTGYSLLISDLVLYDCFGVQYFEKSSCELSLFFNQNF